MPGPFLALTAHDSVGWRDRIGALVMNVVWKRCVMRRRGLWDDLELMHNTISLHYM